MSNLIVDVTPRKGVVGWDWRSTNAMTVFWPVFLANTVRFAPVMATETGTMAVVPAFVENGMAVISPEHASQAPMLFQRQFGLKSNALALSATQTLGNISAEFGNQWLQYIREQETIVPLLEMCARVAPIFTFTAWVKPMDEREIGSAMIFCGKPWKSYERRMLDMGGDTLLNEPWHQTEVAGDLVRLAQRANQAGKDAIPCFAPYNIRVRALAEWHRLVVEADRLAQQFLQDNLPGWAGKTIGFTPTAMPWMATLKGVGDHIRLGDLPIPGPEHLVGGCHIELAN